ncbi:hypothetical protein ACQYRI_19780 [Salmonella enterica]
MYFSALHRMSIILLILGISFNALATPSIGIGSMYDFLAPDKQAMTKRIYNTGTSTAFVRVELLEIFPDKKGKEVESPVVETDGRELIKDRLIVTPLRMIIAPSGFQTVRFIWPGDRKVEKYYRVRFTPVMPEVDDSFGLNSHEVEAYRKKTLNAGLNILAGYGTLVMVQPEHAVFNTKIQPTASGPISVKNNGNTTIALENIRCCKKVDTDCSGASRQFVLPGRTKKIETQKGLKTLFTLIEGYNKKEFDF